MKKIILLSLCFLLVGCATVIQIACNEPNIEIVIDDVNYGVPPIVYRGEKNMPYVDVNFVREGVTIYQQRLYIAGRQNYYEIELPKHLKYSSGKTKFHSSH